METKITREPNYFPGKPKYQYQFNCPGCEREHAFDESVHPWNKNYKKPTLYKNYLISGFTIKGEKMTDQPRCHSIIKKGIIKFLDDCDHKLAGKSIELQTYDIHDISTPEGARLYLTYMGIDSDKAVKKGLQIIQEIHTEIEIREALKSLSMSSINNS